MGMRATGAGMTSRPWAWISYLVLLVPAALLGLGAYDPDLRFSWVEATGLYAHASNLGISFALVLSYGFVRLLTGAGMPEVGIFAALIIACNYAYELWLPLFNTKDPLDAHAGAVGALAALAFLALVARHGLVTPGAAAQGPEQVAQPDAPGRVT